MIKLTGIAAIALTALFSAELADQWLATLSPANGSTVSGTATAEAVGTADSTRVKISIRGAAPNATLPWRISGGRCDSVAAVLGADAAYPNLQTIANGSADASVTLPVRPLKAAPYTVRILGSAGVTACGDLKPVLNKMPGL